MNSKLEFHLGNPHWLNNMEEIYDRCLHGQFSIINNGRLVFKSKKERTVSTTGFYLLNSSGSDYYKEKFASQIVPCCGFSIFPSDINVIDIVGCPEGDDFSISHLDNDMIRFVFENNERITVLKGDFQNAVIDFANTIENFYLESLPKCIPVDNLDKMGYELFWTEWNRLKIEFTGIESKYKFNWSNNQCK